jgi:hypothetical protein
MGLTDKLMQVVNGARKLRASRDPNSYSRYDPSSTVQRAFRPVDGPFLAFWSGATGRTGRFS